MGRVAICSDPCIPSAVSLPLSIASMRDLILSVHPELSGVSFTVLDAGWDSVAVDAGGEYIFKFPRDSKAAATLEKEARLLAVVRPRVSMTIPDLELIPGPPLFSRHRKIPGDHLLAEDYARLPEPARQALAAELALFYHQLHRVGHAEISAAGATLVGNWPAADELARDLRPLLGEEQYRVAEEALARWENLPPDPCGTIYGFFDGHGWNMAFDHGNQRLGGIFDFADSGFGDLHREFIYTDLIDRDLTRRLVGEYEKLGGIPLDRGRIDLLSGILALSDLAGEADHPVHGSFIRRNAENWLAASRSAF